MFDSLADRIKEDAHKEVNTKERMFRWALIVVVSVVAVAVQNYAVRMME